MPGCSSAHVPHVLQSSRIRVADVWMAFAVYSGALMKIDLTQQHEICNRYGSQFWPVSNEDIVGIADNIMGKLLPINGLRHPPGEGNTGWYIWAGESLSQDPDFFRPVCVGHLYNWCPCVIRYLSLAPGWRFLVAGSYSDVWYDAALLDI